MENDNIHLGTWTNWSRGPVFGATVTTTKQYGNFLVAFTAFYIAFVATRSWRILALILHRCRSNPAPQLTFLRQRQIILRNASNAESSLILFIRLCWAWRKLPARRILSLLPEIALAFGCIAAFTVAGGFSSSISTAIGDEVLIRGDNCAILSPPTNTSDLDLILPIRSQRLNQDATYAQQCYQSNASLSECTRFVVSHLPTSSVNTNAKCPFQSEICQTQDHNIQLDTGYLNSHDHLGINAPETQRFALRYVLQCAPLKSEGHTSEVSYEGLPCVKYRYGVKKSGSSDNFRIDDYVFLEKDISVQYSSGSLSGRNFKVSVVLSTSFTPAPELRVPDGDLSLVFLSGYGVGFIEPLDDAWYRATTASGYAMDSRSTGNVTVYGPREAASPMACVEKWQWCNLAYPYMSGCGPLTGKVDALNGAAPFFNLTRSDVDAGDRSQLSNVGTRLIWSAISILESTTGLQVLVTLGAKSLASQDRLYSGIQSPLPNDQWQLDVKHWFEIILSSIQSSFVNKALGFPAGADVPRLLPENTVERELCNSQKIRSTAYTSFSLFGLYFIFLVGAAIILTSFILEPILTCLYNGRRKKQHYANLEWASNTSLQLHRLAHEKLEQGEWSNCVEEIPTTELDVELAGLDVTDPARPTINKIDNGNPAGSETEVELTDMAVTSARPSMERESITADVYDNNTSTSPTPILEEETITGSGASRV
ncbi:hypothetical protein EKO27_g5506 [Xylaria grammica]|uniref:Uncharacterized protein n=1 Tax=Xylaria grammica TaxID=363999 RepID=A0A439D5C6_9PEZI|nr:hypothetical protein EKO27_g5506 [Xylaria grammica]